MKLDVQNKVNVHDWDKNIYSMGGNICHSTAHTNYILASKTNAIARYLSLLSNEGVLVGAAVGFQSRSNNVLLAPFTGRLWLDSLPTVRSDINGTLLKFLELIENFARFLGLTELEVNSSASGLGAVELKKLNFDLTKRFEFELDLELSEEELWQGMEHKRRKNINKAKRSNVVIRELPAAQGIMELRRLQRHSSERIVARGGRDITHEHQAGQNPLMILIESGLGKVIGAEVDGEIVSAGLFTRFNELVYHTLSGHSNQALKTQAPTLLIWDTILRYKEQGARRFNFGGCKISAVAEGDPEHGVYIYKKAFGPACIECTSGSKILRPTTHALVRRIRGLFRR
jgi:hypothetical protein